MLKKILYEEIIGISEGYLRNAFLKSLQHMDCAIIWTIILLMIIKQLIIIDDIINYNMKQLPEY